MDLLTPKFNVELYVERKKHFYRVSGKGMASFLYPGVTGFLQIISRPALLPWAKREALNSVRDAMLKAFQDPENPVILSREWVEEIIEIAKRRPDKIKDDAADFGTQVHKYIDQIIQGRMPPDLTSEMEPAVHAFADWWQKSKIEIIQGDTKVASLKYGYGGSLDALGRQDGKLVILDWKTSNGIYDEYALQVSAYWQAFQETYGQSCEKGFVVRFSKRLPVEFEAREIVNLPESLEAFLSAKELTERMGTEHFL